jgi:hypothetical protein
VRTLCELRDDVLDAQAFGDGEDLVARLVVFDGGAHEEAVVLDRAEDGQLRVGLVDRAEYIRAIGLLAGAEGRSREVDCATSTRPY